MQYGAGGDIEILGSLIVLPGYWGGTISVAPQGKARERIIHLSSTENETLLRWWYARLLFYFLLDTSDLRKAGKRRISETVPRSEWTRVRGDTLSSGSISSSIFPIGIDISKTMYER